MALGHPIGISYGFSMVKCVNPPYDQHYDENNFYNKTGYKEVMESFKKEKNYYKDKVAVQTKAPMVNVKPKL